MDTVLNLETIRSRRLGMILRFSLPSITAMVLTSLITIADGFFIGNYVGKEGLAAVNLGLPIVYLYLALGLMISVGGVAIAGMALGGGDRARAGDVFNQTMCTVVLAVTLLSAGMYFCLDPLLLLLRSDGAVGGFFKAYYGIMLLELPIMVINSSFGMFIRGEGNPRYFMQVNMLNVALNILLDYLFVKWFGWGVPGVAAGSLIAALVTLALIVRFFLKKSQVFTFRPFCFSGAVLKNTVLNGASEFVGEMSLCITMFAYNFVIMKNFGPDGVTAFTIVGYLAYMFSMVLIGFGQGASPLISFVYGAKEYGLAAALRKITNTLVLGCGVALFLLVLSGSARYGSFFVKNGAVQQMVSSGAVIFAFSFLFSGVNTITSFYFTAIGKALESAVISCARGLVIQLACIFTLPLGLGMTGIWLAAPITETLTILISLFFIVKEAKAKFRPILDTLH